MSRYNAEAVDAAIRSSRQKIGRREARAIHALLKGRTMTAVAAPAPAEANSTRDERD